MFSGWGDGKKRSDSYAGRFFVTGSPPMYASAGCGNGFSTDAYIGGVWFKSLCLPQERSPVALFLQTD